MKTLKKRIIIVAVILLFVLTVNTVYANESDSQVSVSYIPDKAYVSVLLTIKVEGNGAVMDKNQSIREGSLVYDLQEDDMKRFTIVADEGYRISKIEFNDGYTATSMLKSQSNQSIDIEMKDKDATLIVAFEKWNAGSGNVNSIGKKYPLKGPITGDNTRIGSTGAAMAGAFLIIILLLKKRKQEE